MADPRTKEVPIACPNYTINSLLMITSTITLLVSLTLKYEFSMFGNYLEYYSGKPILLLLLVSIVTFLDAFLGFISVQKKSPCGIITFAICTMYLFVSVSALVAVTVIFSYEAEEKMYADLKEDMLGEETANGDVIDAIQLHLNCCGYKGLDDWSNDSTSLPRSCCSSSDICDAKDSPDVHTIGCRDAIGHFLIYRKWFVVGVLGVLGIIEIYSIILSLMVYQRLIKSRVIPPTVTSIPRVDPAPSVGNVNAYVRRPTQLPVVLNYRSAHENFLKQPAQNRYCGRLILPSAQFKIPHAR
ncbi:23 kDa integral membrane protein-like [Venturia canescens]|uniref:23 kDa integral membrane protein-like n=1 Tax=Venturia canescens TaxID=32260 RepID=UPI001C9CA87A|nr:23 kDa integral membrane protein-like [Venturia canescens]